MIYCRKHFPCKIIVLYSPPDNLDKFSDSRKKVMENHFEIDSLVEQFVSYGIKGKCMKDCKSRSLPPKLRLPDPVLMKDFERCLPYSYLHYSYYQVKKQVTYS